MFNIFKRVKDLEEKVDTKKFIGEYYGCDERLELYYTLLNKPLSKTRKYWIQFTTEAITEKIENSTKINKVWVKNENIIYYDSIYDKRRKEIENKESKSKDKGGLNNE